MRFSYLIYGYVKYQGPIPHEFEIDLGNLWDDQVDSIVPATKRGDPHRSRENIQISEYLSELKRILLRLLSVKDVVIDPSVLSYYSDKGECGSIECFSNDGKLTLTHHYFDKEKRHFVAVNV